MGKYRAQNIAKLSLVVMTAFLCTACPNNQGTSASSTSSSSKSTAFGGTAGGTLPTGSTENFITISNVLRSNFDPNSMLDLIGQSGEIGQNCKTANDCECVYNWPDLAGTLREAPTGSSIRLENDLIRCSFSIVDSTAKYFDVRVHIISGNLYSNTTRVFLNSANPSLDSTLSSNYLAVQRFMCKDIIPGAQNTKLYTGLIDPQLWDLGYSYNYFTTSLGKDYGANSSPYYECPTLPNDPSDPLYDYNLYSLDPVDLNNTGSNTKAAVGDITIFPVDDNQNMTSKSTICPTGTESGCEKFALNRHDYYLSTFQGGAFSTPVCMKHSTLAGTQGTLNCQIDRTRGIVAIGNAALAAGGQDIIGFAAMPDSNQQCPSPTLLPAGKKWAKVWKFKASIQARTISNLTNADQVGDLFCTTRNQECLTTTTSASPFHSICWDAAPTAKGNGMGGQISSNAPGSSTTFLGNCSTKATTAGDGRATYAYSVDASTPNKGVCYGGPSDNCCQDINFYGLTAASVSRNNPGNYTPGGDWCLPTLIGNHNASSSGGLSQDVWLMGIQNPRACIEADTDQNGKLAVTTFPPPIANPYLKGVKTLDGDARVDEVYVVTPTSVTVESMQDYQNGAIARKYTPFRKMKNAPGGQVQYFLDNGSNNGTGTTGRLSSYPLCVVQDNKQGARTLGSAAP